MTLTSPEREALADALYERHGHPLEAEHWGRYVAIAESGAFVLGDSLVEIMAHAPASSGAERSSSKLANK